MAKYTRKFYVQLSSGDKFEISELDFNNIEGRIRNGRTNGWYVQRDHDFMAGERYGWKVSFDDIASVFADKPDNVDRVIRTDKVDIDKRKDKPVEKKVEKSKKCGHDWNNPDHWEYVTTIHDGRNRYWKMCGECHGKSTLIKKREVELAMEKDGLTLDDVPLVE